MSEAPPLTGYEVLVGVCGGIAAYKVCHVVSRLVQQGAGVTVAMTPSATKFVGPLTFQALTRRRVYDDIFEADGDYDHHHIRLTETADLFLIAPATADIIGKIAAGIADDLVSLLAMCADCPVALAPAMNTRMWNSPIVQRNVKTLADSGYLAIDPEEGWLACRTVGPGRMAEPDTLIQAVVTQLQSAPPRSLKRGCLHGF